MTSDANGPRIIGELRKVDGRGALRVEERFEAAADELWSAITDPERIPHWLGGVDGDLKLGGRFDAFFVVSGWEGECTIEECDAPRRLAISTRESDGSAGTSIAVDLTPDGDETVLVVEEQGMRLGHVAAYAAGMQTQVDSLTAYLRGEELEDTRAHWVELMPTYLDLAEPLIGVSSGE